MEIGAYNIVERSPAHPFYPTRLSIVRFLRLIERGEVLPAREVAVTGLDTLLASVPAAEQPQVARLIRDALQDAANDFAARRQTVQFVVQGRIDRGRFFELKQSDGQYINLSAIFGARLEQKANDWLVAPLWI
jgi:hypothetical protein